MRPEKWFIANKQKYSVVKLKDLFELNKKKNILLLTRAGNFSLFCIYFWAKQLTH